VTDPGCASDLAPADIDSDGDIDLILANHRVYINQGGQQGGTQGIFTRNHDNVITSEGIEHRCTNAIGTSILGRAALESAYFSANSFVAHCGRVGGSRSGFSSAGVTTADIDNDGDQVRFSPEFACSLVPKIFHAPFALDL
jgi:hypothetical protein